MPRFQPKRFEQILRGMIAKVVARTPLSDVTDSSVVKHILAAAARQDDEQYYQMQLLRNTFSIDRAAGSDLDARAADYNPSVIQRNSATRAVGQVVFSRTGTSGTLNIAIGTLVRTNSRTVFQTTELGTITNGNTDSNNVAIVASAPGADGNVATGTITEFETRPAGVATVTNPSPTTSGTDRESDDSFRARIRLFTASLARSTPQAIENSLQNRQDPVSSAIIQTVRVIEDAANPAFFTVFVDDGFGTASQTTNVVGEVVTAGLAGPPAGSAVGGEERLRLANFAINQASVVITSSTRSTLAQGIQYTLDPRSGAVKFTPPLVSGEIITADYERFTGLIEFAQKLVTGDPSDRANFPGLEAAGTFGQVLSPQVLVVSVDVTLTLLDGFERSAVTDAVGDAIQTYINSLNIGDDVLINEIIAASMSTDGVFNVEVTAPTNNLVVGDDQLARISSATLTVR